MYSARNYVHGLSIDAAVLPTGWQRRAVSIRNQNTHQAEGLCIEVHDLAVSKLVAFRDKDRDFVRVLITERLVKPRKLLLRLTQLPDQAQVTPALRKTMNQWIKGVVADDDG